MGEFIGQYRIVRKIGEGGMAQVFLGEHTLLQESVAIKVLRSEYVRNENIRKRFVSEARLLFRLRHPRLLKVTDLIDDVDLVAFVMEYLEGQTLKQYLETRGRPSDGEIQSLLVQMLEGLGYLHASGLVHRDVKPSNFMIDSLGSIKILDLGIVKALDPASVEYTQTHTVQQMGTPMYMSPEQVLDTKSVTPASDLYSVGVVLWQMVSGRKPYDSSSLSDFQLKSKIVHEPLPFTGTPWDRIIQRATAKEVGERYQDVNDWLNQLCGISDDRLSAQKTLVSQLETTQMVTPMIAHFGYPHVRIGDQVWMIENLNVDRFRNGDLIPEITIASEWERAGSNKLPAWCFYENDPANGEKYGRLYNWYAVNDPRGLAPSGWHIPTDEEYSCLTSVSGAGSDAGRKLKSRTGWKPFFWKNGNGVDQLGFDGRPGGFRTSFGSYLKLCEVGNWWSASAASFDQSWYYYLDRFSGKLLRHKFSTACGFSVRCLSD